METPEGRRENWYLVSVQVERAQLPEVSEALRQAPEAVVVEPELLEALEIPEALGQLPQPVVVEEEGAELPELAERAREGPRGTTHCKGLTGTCHYRCKSKFKMCFPFANLES